MENIALIVGGSSGIGKATAKKLLISGDKVIITGRNLTKLLAAQQELSSFGKIEVYQLDMYNQDEITKFAEYINNFSGKITKLINAAGYFNPKPFTEHDIKDYDTYMLLNKAFFFMTQAKSIFNTISF